MKERSAREEEEEEEEDEEEEGAMCGSVGSWCCSSSPGISG